VYFTAVAFLHVAHNIPMQGFNDELMDVLATILGQHAGRRRYSTLPSSVLSLRKAATLMNVVANSSRSTVQLIEIELSKAYLYSALGCKDSESVYCLANVYLVILYYITGQYRAAIDHCTQVVQSQDHSQCNWRAVKGELLPKIDDYTDNVLGLVVFYQYVCTVALKQHEYNDCILTAELFAYYLHISILNKCVASCNHFTLTSQTDVMEGYRNYITSMKQPLHTADLLLSKTVKLSNAKCNYKPMICQRRKVIGNPTELNTSELVELLQKSAVEHLTTYRQFEAREFHSVRSIVTTDFEALYEYKRGEYEYCLQICTQNVHKLLQGNSRIGIFSFWIYPEIIQLLDDDIVSLIALMSMINPKCRSKPNCVCIGQLTLSLYLMTQCQLKLRPSLTELTQTLNCIEYVRGRYSVIFTFGHLVLKFIKCEVTRMLRNV